MRPSPIVFTFCLAMAALSSLGSASSAGAQPPGRPGFDVEQRLAELVARVGLDAAQTQQARAILTDASRQLEQARDAARDGDGGGSRMERRRAILWQVEDRLWAILSCPQKDAFRLYVRERVAEQRGPHGAAPGPGRRDGRGGNGGHGGHGGRRHSEHGRSR